MAGRTGVALADPGVAMRHLTSDLTLSLARHWLLLRGVRAMPSRADLDPLAIPVRALPFVFMVDVAHGRGEPLLTYRLIGTGITRMAGRDLTGREIGAAHYGVHGARMREPFCKVLETGRAMRSGSLTAWADRVFRAETVYLPLGQGGRVDIVLGVTVPLDDGAPVEPAGFQALQFELAELDLGGEQS
jgi:hypothetical protein